jgi:long-subunit fatty acid transport protein
MKNIIKALLYIFVGIAIFWNTGSAQTEVDAYRLSYFGLGYGARSLGLGTAYSGVANDFSAVYWNPAGLGQIKQNEFSLGLSHMSFDNTSTLYGTKEAFSNSGTKLNTFGLVYPFPVTRGSLVFAIGYGRENDYVGALKFRGFNFMGSTISYPDNVDMEGKILRSGGINSWVVAGAVEAAKNLYLGLSINFLSGSYSYNRHYVETDTKNLYTLDQFIQKYTIEEDIGGFTGRLGMLYEFNNHNGRVGINIKFPTYYTVRRNYAIDETEYYDTPDSILFYQSNGTPEYDLTTPFVFNAGLSYTFGDLLLSGNIDFTDWTQMEFSNTTDADLIDENTYIKEDFKATVNFRFGAEYAVPRTDLRLRAGFVYLPSPYTFDSSPNAQKYITGGLGWVIDNVLKFDFGYAYGFWNTNEIVEYAMPDEKIHTNTVIGTVSYMF